MSDIPTSPQQLTPEWLSQALTASGCLDGVRVSDASHEIIGTGKMGDNARYTLSYEGERALGPATLIAKFPAADEQARAMAGAQGAYYNEVMFYRHLAPGTQMRTPAIYASEISEDRTEFVLLMEDMSPAGPGSQLVGESRQHADQCLREAARLAAAYYGNTEIGELDYVMAAARDDGGAFGQALMEQYWPEFHDRFSHGLSAQCIAFGERYTQAHAHFVSRFKGSKTLVHGDFRSENILFHGDIATTVDWQTVGESSALADVAYFMGGSVDTENRREWEKDLVKNYCQYLEPDQVILPTYEVSFDNDDNLPPINDPAIERWDGKAGHTLSLEKGTRRAQSAEMRMNDKSGNVLEISLEPLLLFRLKGIGYMHPEWGHGKWKGELEIAGESWKADEVDPLALENLHIQQVVTARCGDEVGHGVLEQMHIGPYEPYGLTDWFDGAS